MKYRKKEKMDSQFKQFMKGIKHKKKFSEGGYQGYKVKRSEFAAKLNNPKMRKQGGWFVQY